MNSDRSDEEGYDMMTRTNLTPQMAPEFLIQRPMQSRIKVPRQNTSNDDTLDTTLPAQQIPVHNNPQDVPSENSMDPISRIRKYENEQ